MALTDAKIRAAKHTDKAYKLTDGAGMFLLVHPNCSRYWRLRYRILGKEKTLALGVYPEVSLSEARTKQLPRPLAASTRKGSSSICIPPSHSHALHSPSLPW